MADHAGVSGEQSGRGATRPDAAAGRPGTDRFRHLVQHSPDLVSIYDAQGRFSFASPSHLHVLGYEPEEMIGRVPLDFVHPDEVESVGIEFAEQMSGLRPPAPVEMRYRCRDGSYKYLEAVAVDLTAEPAVGGVFVTARDVSNRRRAEMVVQDQARILELVARGAPQSDTLDAVCGMVERWVPGAVAVVLLVENGGVVMSVASAPSASAEVLAVLEGAEAPSAAGEALRVGIVSAPIASEPRNPVSDAVFRTAGLTWWWGAPVFASKGDGVLGSMALLLPERRDPSAGDEQLLAAAGSIAAIAVERARVQARLAHQASHDALTGLPNRDHLVARLHAFARAPSDHDQAAVFFLDLDRFKLFNDSVGHEAGDRLLVVMADRLRSSLRDGDVVARFGGDEFVVACSGLDGPGGVVALATRLLDAVARPVLVEGTELVVSASIGVALVDGRPPEELLRDADAAMYRAKDRGRARYEIFDESLRSEVVARLETERDLRRALGAGELTVHFQPVIALETDRLGGFEALVRWEHPVRGLLPPAAFLEVAEETGLISRIGAIAREAALRQWSEWHRDHPEWGEFIMGVNLAAAEMRDASLPAQIQELLVSTGADPGHVVFETTERVLAADTEVASTVLHELRALGVLLALDDFGTGSSPLLHLRRFPIDAVKLDAALVAGLGVNRDDDVIVDSVISLAHRLGLFVVAEGVETVEQIERLRESGCLLAQGHVFAPALPPAEAERWVYDRLHR